MHVILRWFAPPSCPRLCIAAQRNSEEETAKCDAQAVRLAGRRALPTACDRDRPALPLVRSETDMRKAEQAEASRAAAVGPNSAPYPCEHHKTSRRGQARSGSEVPPARRVPLSPPLRPRHGPWTLLCSASSGSEGFAGSAGATQRLSRQLQAGLAARRASERGRTAGELRLSRGTARVRSDAARNRALAPKARRKKRAARASWRAQEDARRARHASKRGQEIRAAAAMRVERPLMLRSIAARSVRAGHEDIPRKLDTPWKTLSGLAAPAAALDGLSARVS
jgi:hypothetical protein